MKKGLPDSKPSLAPSVIVCVVAICHATLGISRFPPPFACQLHVLRSQFFLKTAGDTLKLFDEWNMDGTYLCN